MKWYQMDAKEVFAECSTGSEGLSAEEAQNGSTNRARTVVIIAVEIDKALRRGSKSRQSGGKWTNLREE